MFWWFTTGAPPGQVDKTFPPNGATNQPTSLTLYWGGGENATSFEYCYDTTNDNACSNWTSTGMVPRVDLSGLSYATTYYWHARAINSFGTTYSDGLDTAFWSFTTGGPPTAFNKSAPANGATNQPTSLILTWNSSPNASSYEYCYDTNINACSNWTNNGSSTSVDLTGLDSGTTYYWHVRGNNSFGTTYSDASPTAFWSFTTKIVDTVTISGNAGVAGATLSYTDGSPKTATTDGNGAYSFTVPYNWSGTVTPSKAGYTFSPVNRTYTNLTSDQTNQNYVAGRLDTFPSNGAYDGWILESSENTNKGASLNSSDTTLIVGDDAKNKQYKSILSFDTSNVPDNAVITSVVLKVKKNSIVGTDPFTTHNGLQVDISKPYFGNSANLVKTDFQATASANQVGTFSTTPTDNWYSVSLTGAAYPFINLTGVTQFRLQFSLDDNNDKGADYIMFYSGNAIPLDRPVLMIEYYVP
jgi:hypothetical protein